MNNFIEIKQQKQKNNMDFIDCWLFPSFQSVGTKGNDLFYSSRAQTHMKLVDFIDSNFFPRMFDSWNQREMIRFTDKGNI